MNGDWYRLEPSNRAPVLEPGLGAAIADPLWMLARQWQVGEFRGEDAARPIRVRWAAERFAISHAFADPAALTTASARPVPDPPVPVEVYVEREQVTAGPARLAVAVEAGVQLLRHLRAAGVSTAVRTELAATFALPAGLPAGPRRGVVGLLAARAPDGAAAYAARDELARLPIVPAEEAAAVASAVAAWTVWYEARFDEPAAADDASPLWRDERMAYRFALATRPVGDDAVVLTADDHPGGDLEWHAFDASVRPRLGLPESKPVVTTGETFPIPVRYGGMPAARYWTFEDSSVHFGGMSSGPADLARMVVAEFASVYSNDWWMLPVRAVAGHLHRVTGVELVDSFGEVHPIPAAAVADLAGPRRPWRFFELTGDRSPQSGQPPWLLVLDTAAGGAEGEPVESVELVRDEQSNLGWAGECAYEAADGLPRRRMDEWRAASDGLDADAASAYDGAWRYAFGGDGTPPLWAPLVPERPDPAEAAVVLRRARMRDWERMPDALVRLRGRILRPDRPFAIDEVELPRSGLTVTRSYQVARDRDGRLHSWAGRRKRLGRGERTIGTRADRIVT